MKFKIFGYSISSIKNRETYDYSFLSESEEIVATVSGFYTKLSSLNSVEFSVEISESGDYELFTISIADDVHSVSFRNKNSVYTEITFSGMKNSPENMKLLDDIYKVGKVNILIV